MISVFRCSKCSKELTKLQRDYMGNHDETVCPNCQYFESIGVVTISDYNQWLKGEFKIGNIKI